LEAEDVVTAYLYGSLNHEIYMKAPDGYQTKKAKGLVQPVVKLRKSLYGLKQAGLLWNQKLSTYLQECGFQNHEMAKCVFVRKSGDGFAILAIYVDDINIIGTRTQVKEVKEMMARRFEMKELGRTSHCIGLQINQLEEGTFVHQTTTIMRILDKYNMARSNPMNTPMEVNGEKELYGSAKEGENVNDPRIPYRSAIGALSWLATRTRPDIAYAVNVLQRNNHRYALRHWEGVKRVMQYLKGTIDVGLWFGKDKPTSVVGFVDAGYKSDRSSGKSQGEFVFTMCGAAISWKSKKQSVVATSTAHAELIALYEGCREAVNLYRVSSFIEVTSGIRKSVDKIVVHEDNEACISQVKSGFVRTDAMKHVDPKYHQWVEQEDNNTVKVTSIASKDNTADIFTKALPKLLHQRHVIGLGLRSHSELRNLGME
jgi:hypothetical protein